ncbi:PadR family transcriptional regulator [Acinetobacter sp. C_4_1]|uniref:PadR family transcriptional regulator n=1 Tax=unclassified Acinetobacter TaxID=196816 RepID=UPI0021B8406E|nr:MULTISPECIES: PadR family transcriptional regulator [unclassified Acinetobacter]MCT8088972.1 PadR family transcriptional regulator [Acinetobacter sp. F_3_1]MCT8097128.1 PadR family transcriptional regulator [Acinetobacter sp. C_3_1]MCT8099879.1 PadR family transcriptional regulator [Acinetobacter sp. C_4_1]MCT8134278.1 PadR family transcriptional regulator [Acinetobacter sp. T_3_1]
MPNSDLLAISESPVKIRKRLFEAGQMKLLVLHFIAQSPKFSYDIIKDVASLVGGNYKPSTGTICPTINYLEEHHYTEVKLSVDERKQYHITAKGLKHLATHQDEINKVLDRFNTRKQIQNNEHYVDIKRAMENLKTSLRLKIQHTELNPEQIREISGKIDQAAVEIARM